MNYLYEFTIPKQYEEKVTETKEENGEKIEISRTIKKVKDIKLAILEPRRKLFEACEIFHAKKISEYIKMDLVPHSLVAKRYLNDGGPLSEPEKERIEKLREEAKDLQIQLVGLDGTDEERLKKRNDIIFRLNEINAENNDIRDSFSEIFDNTVESKARAKTIEWWVLNLIYIDEGEGYKPFFGSGNYEDKLIKYDEFEEKNDLFENEVIKRSFYLIAFWAGVGIRLAKSEFKNMDNIYLETLSSYKIDEDKTDIKNF